MHYSADATIPLEGSCHEDFADVAEEFRRNLKTRGELGASVAVMVGGETVVDLWGGWTERRRTRPWQEDTLCVTMSCTKGAAALCAHLLAAAGELDFDAPVCRYWPEFRRAGKQEVLVRHVLSHQAGLPALRAPLKAGAFYDWEYMVDRLAAEELFWRPGSTYGYHGFTFGYLVGELVRRISGASIGAFFREEVAEPLGIDYWIGLPSSEHARVSRLNEAPVDEGMAPQPFFQVAMEDPTSVQAMMLDTGGYLAPHEWNSPVALSAELPSSGGVGNARSMAAMYHAIVPQRKVGRFRFQAEHILRMTAVASAASYDHLVLEPDRWSLGFRKTAVTPRGGGGMILSEDAFGGVGLGGSVSFADPVADLSFAYVMNQMDCATPLGERGQSLVDAVYRTLGYRQDRYRSWVRDARAQPFRAAN